MERKLKPEWLALLGLPLLIPFGASLMSNPDAPTVPIATAAPTSRAVAAPAPTSPFPRHPDVTAAIKYDRQRRSDETFYLFGQLLAQMKRHPKARTFELHQAVPMMDGSGGRGITVRYNRVAQRLNVEDYWHTTHTTVYEALSERAIAAAAKATSREQMLGILARFGVRHKLNAI